MKITEIVLERLRLPLDPPFHAAWDPVPRRAFEVTLVRVHTDEGVSGVGSGTALDGFERHRHLFLGTDPLDIAAQVRTIETLCGAHGAGYRPVEAACWDILGKVTGQPVALLFGNATRRLPAYASTGESRSPEARVESVLAARERGFRAVKLRIERERVHEGLETVRRTRAAVGADFEIMVDLDQSRRRTGDQRPAADLVRVRKLVAELGELGVYWVEEPLPYADLPGLKRLRADIPHVRIAAGQLHHSVPELLRSLELDALDVYRMDAVRAVGMLRARTLAELALLRHRQYSPHSWTDGIGLLANLHVAAGVGGGPYLEFPYDPPGWTPQRRDFMLAEPVDIDPDGYLTVPQTPGLGVELDEDAVRRYRTG
ncbi:MAG TPA: mandelate racemase/muconate lactonizing enzyme family protein [Actinospica sp.]|nr:mandelate racemase/muconate lactonizing enzyme family protein [Actinospica sp.]